MDPLDVLSGKEAEQRSFREGRVVERASLNVCMVVRGSEERESCEVTVERG